MKAVSILLRGALGMLLLAAGLWALVILAIYAYGGADRAAPADAIVVLGAAQYDGRPSPVLRARLDHAIGLYQAGLAPYLITTGGVGVGDTVSEAVVGRRYAIRAGVPANAILTEERGVRTIESLRAVSRLMRDRNLNTAILVSDPFHALRLRILATQVRIRTYSSPTRTSPISADPGEEWRHVFRESGILLLMLLPGEL